MSMNAVKTLFTIAAWYDIILGAVFGLFFKPIYERFNSTLPTPGPPLNATLP